MTAYAATSFLRWAYLVAVVRILVPLCFIATANSVSASGEQIHNIEVAETKQSDDSNVSPYMGMSTGEIPFRPIACHDSQCHGHGTCLDNACVCLPHWGGTYCSTFIVDDYAATCPDPACSGHGRCDVGMCRCDVGWSGATCSIGAVCSDWCNSPGGTCQNGFCVCNRGWGGSTCGERTCPHQCWGHGVCDHGNCVCAAGWEGDECEIRMNLGSQAAPSPWTMGDIFNFPNSLFAPAPAPGPMPSPSNVPPPEDVGWTLGPIFNFLPAPSSLAPSPNSDLLPSTNSAQMQPSPPPSLPPSTQPLPPGVVLPPPGLVQPQAFAQTPSMTNDPNILLLEKKRSTRKHPFVFTNRMFENALKAAEHKPAKPVIRAINDEPVASRSALSEASDVHHVDSSALGTVASSAMHQVQSAMEAAQRAVAAAGILERAAAQEKMYLRKPATISQSSPMLHAFPASSATRSEMQKPFALGNPLPPATSAPTTPKPASLAIGTPTVAPGGCIDDCSGHGSCNNQVCSCTDGWSGEACDLEPCINGCNGRGACLQGSCVCNAAFYGISCEYSRCLNDCSGHGLCNEGKCLCDTNWVGDTCSEQMQTRTPPPFAIPVQSKKIYLRDALSGFIGKTPKECPENCNGNGKCSTDSGACDCFPGYSGIACQDFCPNFCSGQGKCTLGRCLCLAGFIGVDCSIKACCSGHGDCTIPDTCICNPGWIGDQCQMAMQCPDPSCSGHGTCQNGQCACEAGFSGVTCASPPLECGACKPGSQCDRATGLCLCGGTPCKDQPGKGAKGKGGAGGDGPGGGLNLPGGFGNFGPKKGGGGKGGGEDTNGDGLPDSVTLPPAPGGDSGPTDLNLHPNCNAPTAGKWNATIEQCECNGDYYGDNCQNQHCADWNATLDNPDCSGHGMCVSGNCFCATGWGKKDGTVGVNICSDPVCPIDCGLHGMCKENLCICQEGWQGPACREPRCLNECSGHGTCTFVLTSSPAECQCDYGYSGADCSGIALYQKLQSCPSDCSGNGLCMNGKCICSEGGSGVDCSGTVCPPGRSGVNCEQIACARDCMGYGMCFNGECACDNDHTGSDCSIPMKCFDACYEICLPALESPRCESCKGQCLTALNGASIGKHNPLLARLYSLADLGQPGSEQNATSLHRTTTKNSVSQYQPRPVKASAPEVQQRLRRKHKEVSAVQTSHHAPRMHREVSSVRVGSFKLR